MKPQFEILAEVSALSEEKAGFGAVETERGRLPLKAMDLSGRITGLHFRNRLSQTYVNAYPEPLEATYIFPLPDRAAVVSFKMRVGEREIEGVLKEREQARAEYDLAIADGHRAAIAEEERPDVFTMRAGNLMPGESLSVELELSGPLQFSDGEATYRFPLVVAPRYIPGIPLEGESVGSGTAVDTDAVPDASRITPPLLLPGQPNPVHLSLSLELDPAGLPLRNLRASLHDLVIEEAAEGVCRVSLHPGATRLDRDFLLRFESGEDAVVGSVWVLPDAEGPESTFALTVVPPTLKKCAQNPRDVVVVLDRSGSMSGWKMVAARRAAARILDSLTEHDRFALLLFDSVLEEPFETSGKLVAGNDRNRFRAVEFLARVEARGGTEIGPALARSLEYFGRGQERDRERVVVFVTDGQVGNEAQVLEHATGQARPLQVRIHAVGIDRAVNVSFLSELAGRTGGTFELVESEERLDATLKSIHRRIGHPVLRDVKIRFGDLAASDLTPELADVFPGVPLVVSGRLPGKAPAQATVEGLGPDGQTWQKKLKVQSASDPVLRHVWARARVLDMQHVLDAGRGNPGLGDEITAFSLRWGVLCRFTAFVAVDRSEVANPSGRVHQVTQAVEAPSGWKQKREQAPAQASPESGRRCYKPAPSPMMRAESVHEGFLGGAGVFEMLSAPPPAKPVLGGRPRAREAASEPGDGVPGGLKAPPPAKKALRTGYHRSRESDVAEPHAPPEVLLRRLLAELEKSLAAWKKQPVSDGQPVEDACLQLEQLGTEAALRLAEQGRSAWRAYQRDPALGWNDLEAWVEALAGHLGVKRRKSWWKR